MRFQHDIQGFIIQCDKRKESQKVKSTFRLVNSQKLHIIKHKMETQEEKNISAKLYVKKAEKTE